MAFKPLQARRRCFLNVSCSLKADCQTKFHSILRNLLFDSELIPLNTLADSAPGFSL